MKRPRLAFAVLMLAGLPPAGEVVRAQVVMPEAMPPVVSTSTNAAYPPVTCTSADALACADALQLASDTREQLSSLLQLGPTWRFPVHVHLLTPGDPLAGKINREAFGVFAQGNSLKIEVVVPSSDPSAREYIQRQYVTALLWEKFFANTKTFDKHTKLRVVPIWLVEGLREWLNEDKDHNRENIVRHAVERHLAPPLSEVTGWKELSGDRLLGLWQRAFSYYLVDSLVKPGDRRDEFQLWLHESAGATSSAPGQLHFPTERAWQRELEDATSRSRSIVYSWSESQVELIGNEKIAFAESKESPVQVCTLDTVVNFTRTPVLVDALKQRIFVLTELQLRSHPGWQAILQAYCTAMTALMNNEDPVRVKRLFVIAHKLRLAEIDFHQKLLDYTNWFEVTKDYGGPTHFQSYFDTANEMERVEADPAHPNPIRANLLQIELEL